MQSVTPSSRIPCEVPGCSKTFHRKYEKQRHVDTVHGSATPFNCQVCDKTFLRKDKLFEHLRRIHTTRLNSEPKRRSMISDTSEYPHYGTLSVLPSDTLVRANSNAISTSESWMGGNGEIFAEQNHDVGGGQRSSWAAGLGWQSDSPQSTQLWTNDSPICVDETPPEFF